VNKFSLAVIFLFTISKKVNIKHSCKKNTPFQKFIELENSNRFFLACCYFFNPALHGEAQGIYFGG